MAEFKAGLTFNGNLDLRGNRLVGANFNWSGQSSYSAGDIVVYDGILYIATQDIAAPGFNVADNNIPAGSSSWMQAGGLRYIGEFEGANPTAAYEVTNTQITAIATQGANTAITLTVGGARSRNAIRAMFTTSVGDLNEDGTNQTLVRQVYHAPAGDAGILGTNGFTGVTQADFVNVVSATNDASNNRVINLVVEGDVTSWGTNDRIFIWDDTTPAVDRASVWYATNHEEFHYYDNNGDVQSIATKQFVFDDAATLFPESLADVNWIAPEGFWLYRNSIWIAGSAMWRYYGYSLTDTDVDADGNFRRSLRGDNAADVYALTSANVPSEPRNLLHLDASNVDTSADPVQGRISITRTDTTSLADTVGNATAFFDLGRGDVEHYAISNVGKTFTFSGGDATLYRVFNAIDRTDGVSYYASADNGATGNYVGQTTGADPIELWVSEAERDRLVALVDAAGTGGTGGTTVTSDGVTLTINDVYNRLEWIPLGIGGGSVTTIGELAGVIDTLSDPGNKILVKNADGSWTSTFYTEYEFLTTTTELANRPQTFGVRITQENGADDLIYRFGSDATLPQLLSDDITITSDTSPFQRFEGGNNNEFTITWTEQISLTDADGETDTENTAYITAHDTTLEYYEGDNFATLSTGGRAAPATWTRVFYDADDNVVADFSGNDVVRIVNTATISDQVRQRVRVVQDIDVTHSVLGDRTLNTNTANLDMAERAAATAVMTRTPTTVEQFTTENGRTAFSYEQTVDVTVTVTGGTIPTDVTPANVAAFVAITGQAGLTPANAAINATRDEFTFNFVMSTQDDANDLTIAMTGLDLVSDGNTDTTAPDVIDATVGSQTVTITPVSPAYTVTGFPSGNVDVFDLPTPNDIIDITNQVDLNTDPDTDSPIVITVNNNNAGNFTLNTGTGVYEGPNGDTLEVAVETSYTLPAGTTVGSTGANAWTANYTDGRNGTQYDDVDRNGTFTTTVFGYTSTGSTIPATFEDANSTFTATPTSFNVPQGSDLYIFTTDTLGGTAEVTQTSNGLLQAQDADVFPQGTQEKTRTFGNTTVLVTYNVYLLSGSNFTPATTWTFS